MKTLSIRQPWAWAILFGGKDVENRKWRTYYRGPLLIHAGRREEAAARRVIAAIRRPKQTNLPTILPRGGIIGRVELVDCVQGHKSPWAEAGAWHWILENPKPMDLIPMRGQLGLFEVRL